MGIHSQISDAWKEGKLVLFIGGDLPCKVTGIPSRSELARVLMPAHSGMTLAEAADSQNVTDPHAVCLEHIQNAHLLDHFFRQVSTLVQKQPNLTIVTTAFDDHLKRHFEGIGVEANSYVFDKHLGQSRVNCPSIYHLFGLVDQPESLVIRQRTHLQLGDDPTRRHIINAVRLAIRQNTVLFVGYSFSDAEIQALLPSEEEQRYSPPTYVFWPGILDNHRLRLEHLGLTVLEDLSWETEDGDFSLDASWYPEIERSVQRQMGIPFMAANPAEFDLNNLVEESGRWLNGRNNIVGMALTYQDEPLPSHYYKRLNDNLFDGRAEVKSRQKIDPKFNTVTQKLSEIEKRYFPLLISRPVILPLDFTKLEQVAEFWSRLKALVAEKQPRYRLIVILHMQEEWQLPDDIFQLPQPRFHLDDIEAWIETVRKSRDISIPRDVVQIWKEVFVAECQTSDGDELQIPYVYEHIEDMIHQLVSSGLEGLRASLEEKRSIYCVPA